MPVYEYSCDGCGHEFEREQRITEAPTRTCPRCKARKARRLISRTSFVLKGSGWYSDLYASPSAADKGDKKEEKSEGKGDAKEKKKKETAPSKKGSGDSGTASKPAA